MCGVGSLGRGHVSWAKNAPVAKGFSLWGWAAFFLGVVDRTTLARIVQGLEYPGRRGGMGDSLRRDVTDRNRWYWCHATRSCRAGRCGRGRPSTKDCGIRSWKMCTRSLCVAWWCHEVAYSVQSPQLLSQAFRKTGSQAGHLTSRNHRHMPNVFSQGGANPSHHTLPHMQGGRDMTAESGIQHEAKDYLSE